MRIKTMKERIPIVGLCLIFLHSASLSRLRSGMPFNFPAKITGLKAGDWLTPVAALTLFSL